jgi:hypothetical protein
MRRLSPLTIAAALLAVTVIGGGAFLAVRPRHRAPVADEPLSEPPAPPPPPAPVTERPRPQLRLRPPAESPFTAPTLPAPPQITPPVAAVEVPAGPDAGVPPFGWMLRRRQLAVAAVGQRAITQADERLFEMLQLPEATRAAVRQLNAESERRTRESLEAARQAPAGPVVPTGPGSPAETRRAALETLVGPEMAKAFDAAESDATHRLRIQARRWSPQEIDTNLSLSHGGTTP